MKTLCKLMIMFAFVASLALAAPSAVLAEDGPEVAPILVDGNPTCTDLGYAYGYKIDPPMSGVFEIPAGSLTVTMLDAKYFDWLSTFGMDAVIVKAQNANSYVYDPPAEAKGDTGLHAPANNSGYYADISHIEFCYDYELAVTKTANTTYSREYTWEIFKTQDGVYDLFVGDSVIHPYTVRVNQIVSEYGFQVDGSVTIHNPDPTFTATITNVQDVLSDQTTINLNCGVTFPYALLSGADLTCTYSQALPDKTNLVNTAIIPTTGKVGGGIAQTDVIFGEPTTVIGLAEVDVTDTNGQAWHASGDAQWSYSTVYACGADEGSHVNKATITQTGQEANATVTLNCYELQISKDATPTFTRTYEWGIQKNSSIASLTLAIGQVYPVPYTVLVDATPVDSDWTVAGTVTLTNPAPIPAPVVSLTDNMAALDCGVVNFPYLLPAGETLPCTYKAALPDGAPRTNKATATLQNQPSGVTLFETSAAVNFTTPTLEIDKGVTVTDSLYGALGALTFGVDSLPYTFTYLLPIGPYSTCGDYDIDNIATLETSNLHIVKEAAWHVDVNIPCGGCTLTIGYWKTHAGFGPQPDMVTPLLPIWLGTPGGDKSIDVTTTAQAVKILNKFALASNGVNRLYAQLLGAKLNIANGADGTAIAGLIAKADLFLANHNSASWITLSKTQRNAVNNWAVKLDNYNNGLIGPGHCSQ